MAAEPYLHTWRDVNLIYNYTHIATLCHCKARSDPLSSKELFTLRTPLTLASRTSQTHLLTAVDAALQMLFGDVCKRLNENRRPIKTLRSLDRIRVTRFADDFLVQLVQCFDVVRGKCDGDEDEVLLTLSNIALNGTAGLSAEPWFRSNL